MKKLIIMISGIVIAGLCSAATSKNKAITAALPKIKVFYGSRQFNAKEIEKALNTYYNMGYELKMLDNDFVFTNNGFEHYQWTIVLELK